MPPWSPRLHLNSPAPGSGLKSRVIALNSPPDNQIGNITYNDQYLQGVPVTVSSSSTRPSHGRSYSYPLPIFSSGKKAENIKESDVNDDTLKALNDYQIKLSGITFQDLTAANETSLHSGEEDLIIGKCTTCNSRVRWPRHLDVFRCTVCLMVNDLKPLKGGRWEDWEEGKPSTSSPYPGLHRKGIMAPILALLI